MVTETNRKIMYIIVGEENYNLIKEGIDAMDKPDEYNDIRQAEKIAFKFIWKQCKGQLSKSLLREMVEFAAFSDTEEEKNKIRSGEINYCGGCGWCCKNCKIHIVKNEVQRLISYGVPAEYFKRHEDELWTFSNKPCLLIGKNNRCEVYKYRPGACKSYPLTLSKGELAIAKRGGCAFAHRLIVERVQSYLDALVKLEHYEVGEEAEVG